jgi:hypothetical protein
LIATSSLRATLFITNEIFESFITGCKTLNAKTKFQFRK